MIRNLINRLKTLKGIVFPAAHFNETRVKNCLLLSLFIKALYLLWQANEYRLHLYPGCSLALVNGDALEYIAGAQNIIINGTYYPDAKMPGYPVLLSLFLRLFSLPVALDAVVVVQTAISAVSVVVLAKTAFFISRSRAVFLSVFFVYLVSTYVSVFDKYVLTESLSISFVIFSAYFFIRGSSGSERIHSLLFCGSFAALAVFLRPALFVLFLSYALFLLVEFLLKRTSFRQLLIPGLCIVIPFLILDGIWVKRNFVWHRHFIPLMSFEMYHEQAMDSYYLEEVEFVRAWGGDIVHWEPKAEIRWFGCGKRFKADTGMRLPGYIYTPAYTYDSLLLLRQQMRVFDHTHDTTLKKEICGKLRSFTLSFQTEKKFLYSIIPLRYLYKLVLNAGGTFNLYARTFPELGIFDKLIKLVMILLFETVAVVGCLLAFTGLAGFKSNPFIGFISSFIVINLIVISFGFRMCEYRYFAPDYPFCIVILALAAHQGFSRRERPA